MKKIILIILFVLMIASPVMAAKGSADVVFPDGVAGVIEYSTRGGRSPFITCVYFSAGYVEHLGNFAADLSPSDPLGFCLDNYENRIK